MGNRIGQEMPYVWKSGLVILLLPLCAGLLVSSLGLLLGGLMILFNDTGESFNAIELRILSMLVTSALFAANIFIVIYAIRKRESRAIFAAMAGMTVLAIWMAAVPSSRLAFEFAIELARQSQ